MIDSSLDKTGLQKKRVVIDLLNEKGELYFRLGRANFVKAGTPLGEHIHEGMVEIVLMIKGSQVYTVNGNEYKVNSGDVFITLPGELHSSGHYPEDKSLIYYIIIDLESDDLSLGYNKEDTRRICENIYGINQRVFKINPEIKRFCDSIIEAYYSKKDYLKTIFRNQISNFILGITDCISHQKSTTAKSDLEVVLEYINFHIYEEISVAELAEVASLSVSRFKTRFRYEIGIPPREYILRQKVERAKVLIASADKNITDISFEIGFSSSQYFSTVFKRFTNTSPMDFRKNKCR